METTRTRLPGIIFQTASPPPRTVLPRMDIAAFVGFASCGPLHRPVAVEDMARFRDVFGDDLPLVWDAEREETVYAHLGPAVEAFFRNEGQRCWIVRVADEAQAQTNQFTLPGLYAAGDGGPAVAEARCPGSWSDALRVGTVLNSLNLGVESFARTPGSPDDGYTVELHTLSSQVGVGELLRFTFDAGLLCFLSVDAVTARSGLIQRIESTGAHWFQANDAAVEPAELILLGLDALTPLAPPDPLLDSLDAPVTAERLRFEVLVWQGQEIRSRLGALAFDPRHDRYWGLLPRDADLFAWENGAPVPITPGTLSAEVTAPRFPLAGPDAATEADLYLPLGMATAPDPEQTTAALGDVDPDTVLARNGLEAFDADLFLDAALEASGTRMLLSQAWDRIFLRGESLHGLHSLFPLEEVTLVAVPDAAHRSWDAFETKLPDVLPAPTLLPIPEPDVRGIYRVRWTGVQRPETPGEAVEAYVLEEATDPLFCRPRTRYTGPDTDAGFVVPEATPEVRYYRVRAEDEGRRSPWSNTQAITVPAQDFEACVQPPEAPVLHLLPASPPTSPPEDDVLLGWTLEQANAGTTFTLQRAGDPAFLTAEHVLKNHPADALPMLASLLTHPVEEAGRAIQYYRVRAKRGSLTSPWSNTVVFSPEAARVRALVRPDDYDDRLLLAVHRALLRFCTARGDVFAVLSLPRHYREDEALAHKGLLTPHADDDLYLGSPGEQDPGRVRPLSFDEEPALSFGALYHPWLYTRAETGAGAGFRLTTPDGAVVGAMAAQALTRGAWTAPANRPLRGVAALDPDLDRAGWTRLFAGQVNLVRNEPRGFLLLSADTLSPEVTLQPINVRRLLILLRRLVLREGPTYVFESNTADLRRRIYYQFDALLAGLYQRGAFAGRTTAEAYRVVTDESVNSPSGVDRGQLVVELRVAPSQPLAFLTVRLVQREVEGLVVEEV